MEDPQVAAPLPDEEEIANTVVTVAAALISACKDVAYKGSEFASMRKKLPRMDEIISETTSVVSGEGQQLKLLSEGKVNIACGPKNKRKLAIEALVDAKFLPLQELSESPPSENDKLAVEPHTSIFVHCTPVDQLEDNTQLPVLLETNKDFMSSGDIFIVAVRGTAAKQPDQFLDMFIQSLAYHKFVFAGVVKSVTQVVADVDTEDSELVGFCVLILQYNSDIDPKTVFVKSNADLDVPVGNLRNTLNGPFSLLGDDAAAADEDDDDEESEEEDESVVELDDELEEEEEELEYDSDTDEEEEEEDDEDEEDEDEDEDEEEEEEPVTNGTSHKRKPGSQQPAKQPKLAKSAA